MSDLARNTRTLIASFVIALAVLVPLRFYEAGEDTYFAQLDTQTQNSIAATYSFRMARAVAMRPGVPVAMAPVAVQEAVLGATTSMPIETQVVENNDCIDPANVSNLVSSLSESYVALGSNATSSDAETLASQIAQVEARVCKF